MSCVKAYQCVLLILLLLALSSLLSSKRLKNVPIPAGIASESANGTLRFNIRATSTRQHKSNVSNTSNLRMSGSVSSLVFNQENQTLSIRTPETDSSQAFEPENQTLFTPAFVKQGRLHEYMNLPAFPVTPEMEAAVQKAIDKPAGEPQGLLYQANPPGVNAVVGISAYVNNIGNFERWVGSLRHTGYDGKIILGVHKQISKEERDYLESMDVTMYEVEFVPCGVRSRGTCAKGFETLKLEWCRFEMSRQWLRACKDCTGWTLIMDTRDAFFQANPFASLPDPSTSPYDLFFIEEIALHTCPDPHDQNPWRWYNIKDNHFYKPPTEMCYGRNHWAAYGDRPVLCSGTTIGTRVGIDRFLSVMSDEFYRRMDHPIERCRTPTRRDTDQWIMIYLYYHGRFGRTNRTRTIPWGTGPVNTVGHACANNNVKPSRSHADIVMRDNTTGLILNNYEGTNSPHRVAAVIHQFDRCLDWIEKEYVPQHEYMFSRNYTPKLSWKPQKA